MSANTTLYTVIASAHNAHAYIRMLKCVKRLQAINSTCIILTNTQGKTYGFRTIKELAIKANSYIYPTVHAPVADCRA